MKKMSPFLAVVIMLSMILAACQPAAPATPEPTTEIIDFNPTLGSVQPTSPAATQPPATEETAAPAETEKVADPDATVTVALETIIENLDYMTNSSLNAAGIFEMMHSTLVTLDDNVTLQPSVATNWEVSEDGLVWTFHLRDDVTFWDGTPLTAEDVKYTFERMQEDPYNIGNTNYLNTQFNFDKAVVVDPYTIEVYTRVPVPALLYTIEEINILPKHVYETLTPEQAAAETIMGSGPFKFVSFTKDDRVVLERYDGYWEGPAAFKTLIYRAIPEASTRVAELETGGVDVIQNVPMAQLSTINAMPNASAKAMINGCRMSLGFNHESPIYSDVNVRLAMNHAIDWDTINQAFFQGNAPRLAVHINKPWRNEALEPYPYDLAKVDELMTASGWTKNAAGYWEKDGQELAPSIMVYYAQSSERYEILLSLVDQLNKAGFKAEPYYLESAAAFEKLDKREVDDMFMIGSCTSYEGQGDLSDLAADSASNYGRWRNDEFEEVYAQLLTEFDVETRRELIYQLQDIIYADAPQIPLYVMIGVWGINNDLDWSPNPAGRALMYGAVKYK